MGIFSRLKKSVRRISRGKFHLNPLKNGVHATSDPVGHLLYQGVLSPHQKRRLKKAIDYGRLKKKYLRLGTGNNSASTVYVNSGGYMPGGYVYSGRSIGDLV